MLKNFLKFDWVAVAVVFFLIAIGLMSLFSISISGQEYFFRQVIAVAIGFVIMLALSAVDYRAFVFYSTKIYFGAVIILAVVIIWGIKARGIVSWLGTESFHFQPVEIVKLAMIIFFAGFLSKKKLELGSFSQMTAAIILAIIPIFLVILQPDFGSAMVIFGVWVGMLIVSGISRKSLLILLAIIAVVFSSGWFFLKDYQKERIVNLFDPMNDPKGSGYNVIQSTVAVGSGGFFGKGLGHGSQSQLNFLPEKHTDFIFAVIAEELGLFGSSIILVLFGLIIYRMKETARLARDNFGYLLAVGIVVMIVLQVAVNIGMNVGLAPVAGIPLPFVSYGGSSMVALLAAFGITQSIYARRLKII